MAEQEPTNRKVNEGEKGAHDVILDLVTGKTLGELTTVRDQILEHLGEAHTLADQLRNGTSEEVVKALRVILSTGATAMEFPALPALEAQAKPQHRHTELVRLAVQADVPVWLYGEASSGKSTTAHIVAESLDIPFRSISLGPSTSKSELIGY